MDKGLNETSSPEDGEVTGEYMQDIQYRLKFAQHKPKG